MSEKVSITKIEAARRQLDLAIDLTYRNSDPVSVHTLVGAASNIISDLISKKSPEESWNKFAQESNNLSPGKYFGVMRVAQNFFKHASDDPDAILEFTSEDTDSLAFFAISNLAQLGYDLSVPESVFHLWYLACYSPVLTEDDSEPYKLALEFFGDLREHKRDEQIGVGNSVLSKQLQCGA